MGVRVYCVRHQISLIDKGMNKTKLRDATRMSSSTMAKLGNNEPVALTVLEKICANLDCDFGDIISYISDDECQTEKKTNEEMGDK